jgi:hypothetical protein
MITLEFSAKLQAHLVERLSGIMRFEFKSKYTKSFKVRKAGEHSHNVLIQVRLKQRE